MLTESKIRNAFLYRFTAVNIFGLALLGAAFHQGWITEIYDADSTRITWVIATTFVAAVGISVISAIDLNKLWNGLTDDPSLMWNWRTRQDSLGLKLAASLQVVNHAAQLLLLMGISGTIVGIILALKSTEAFSTGGQANMVLAIILLFKGVYVKFYASLVGIITHMWILNNYNMLTSMSRRLLARVSDR